MPVYVVRLVGCDGTETADEVSTGEPAHVGHVVTVDGGEWRVQKIVDSGIDQIDEALICTPGDGCDYELVLQDLAGSSGKIPRGLPRPAAARSGVETQGRWWNMGGCSRGRQRPRECAPPDLPPLAGRVDAAAVPAPRVGRLRIDNPIARGCPRRERAAATARVDGYRCEFSNERLTAP